MTPRRLVPILLVAAWIALSGAACDLFTPAKPEAPQGEVIIGNYSDPESTLATIATAIRSKGNSGGADAYRRALADTALDRHNFYAYFDPATVIGFTNVPNPFRSVEEQVFYGKFMAYYGNLAYDMKWSEGQATFDPTDSLIVLDRKYQIYLRQSTGVVNVIGQGYAQLHFWRSGNNWVLMRWFDREDPSVAQGVKSYGRLRLENQ
jgi:hypothetical protein